MTEQIVDTTSTKFVEEMYGTKKLRWFQIAARNGVAKALRNESKRILVVLPTGIGKTLTIAAALSHFDIRAALGIIDNRPLRVLFVAHKHRLLTQAENTFIAESNVELMLQSMMSQISEEYIKKSWDIIVLDEAHHEATFSFQYHLERLGAWPIVGLTATPDRSSGELIKFDIIINPISREQAVKEGYLSPTRIHSFVDVSGKDKTPIMTDIFTKFAHEMGQTLVFVKTKKEVNAITNVLNALGHTTVGLTNQSDYETNNILDKFSAGEIQFVVNCSKISEGVDVKGCTGVVIAKNVGSYPLLNQLIGRAARIDVPECNVYELINPLSSYNMDTTCVASPEFHRLLSKESGKWTERIFDYISHKTNKQLGISSTTRVVHQ